MKVRIINANCPKCGGYEFSLDKNRNHYTNKEKTEGYHITTKTCLNCGWQELTNKIEWHMKESFLEKRIVEIQQANEKLPEELKPFFQGNNNE